MTSVAFLLFIFFSIPLKGVVFYRGVGNFYKFIYFGAGNGNRTRAVGSEAQHSTTKLYPRI